MTEKIIINGVDVAGCEYYKFAYYKLGYSALKIEEYHDCVERALIQSCNANPNCYYKQLQRLKQEKDELTQQSDEKSLEITKLAMKNCELEKENEKLKEELKNKIRILEEG